MLTFGLFNLLFQFLYVCLVSLHALPEFLHLGLILANEEQVLRTLQHLQLNLREGGKVEGGGKGGRREGGEKEGGGREEGRERGGREEEEWREEEREEG